MWTSSLVVITFTLLSVRSQLFIPLPHLPQERVCGNTVLTNISGIINSPLASIDYRPLFRCLYHISVGQNKVIALRFLSFDLKQVNSLCSLSWLKISCSSDGSAEAITRSSIRNCERMRWNSTLKLYDCPNVLLEYYWRYSLPGDDVRFRLQYTITSIDNSSRVDDLPELPCGQTSFVHNGSATGVITLPYRSNITLAKVNCTYTIEVNKSSTISLDISVLDILTLTDSLEECNEERFKITCQASDGDSALPERNHCRSVRGEVHPIPIVYNCRNVEIFLNSDNYDSQEQLQIPYTIQHFHAENPDTHDDDDDDDDDYGGDGEREEHGDYSCGHTLFTAKSATIKSPNFPLSYPHNINCTYHVVVGQENLLLLKFVSFHLEKSNQNGNCMYDWLTMKCLSNGTSGTVQYDNKKLCGEISWSSALRFSGCSSVLLTFIADISVAEGGFKILYSVTANDNRSSVASKSVLPCGNTLSDESTGIIQIPHNPFSYLASVNCTYSISTNRSSMISLNLTSLNATKITDSFRSCSNDRLTLHCAEGDQLQTGFDLCQGYSLRWIPIVIFSYCRTLQLSLYSDYFDLQQVNQIPFTVTSADEICGSTSLSARSGNVTSPGFPAFYPPYLNCTYYITVGKDYMISLNFTFFEIENPSYWNNCTNDWLMMTCVGSSKFNPYENRRFCGTVIWPPVIRFFECSTLMLTFFSDSSVYTRGFGVEYNVTTATDNRSFADSFPEISCGTTRFTMLSGAIILPFDSRIPVATVNCSYYISMPGRSNELSLNFDDILKVTSIFSDCDKDYLMMACVNDGQTDTNSTMVRKYCRDNPPFSRTSNYLFTGCDQVELSLRAHNYYRPNPTTFSISYTVTVKECNNSTFTSLSGNITSPRFPLPYPHGLNCTYTITVPSNMTVSLKFWEFHLEGQSEEPFMRTRIYHYLGRHYDLSRRSQNYDTCLHDWLIIQCLSNGSPLDNIYTNRRLCGRKTNVQMNLVGCQTVTLLFATDGSVSESGFRIEYIMRNISSTATSLDCGNTFFTNRSGLITSPSSPLSNLHTINCSYVISVGHNQSVSLQFLKFDLQGDSFNRYYYLADYCTLNWIRINCVSNGTAAIINEFTNKKLCGWKTPFTTALVGCFEIVIEYFSDSTIRDTEFRIQYRITETTQDDCGSQIFSGSTGVITSPNYPLSYPHSISCTYTIVVGLNNSLLLNFSSFELEGESSQYPSQSDRCSYDWLQINCLSGGSVSVSPYGNRRLCGIKRPFQERLQSCHQVSLNLFTDSTVTKGGFKVHYSISSIAPVQDDCGSQMFSDSAGVITSPRYPFSYPHSINCTYVIVVEQSSSLLLNFSSFDLEGESSVDPTLLDRCSYDWLQINCLSVGSALVNPYTNKRLCGVKGSFQVKLLGCRQVTLNLFTDSSVTRGGFKVHYSINSTTPAQDDCGSQVFSGSAGVITSPHYPLSYPHSINCTYAIVVEQSNSLLLNFSSFDLEGESSVDPTLLDRCSYDWLQINCLSEGLESVNPYTNRKLCGLKRPFQVKLDGCRQVILNLFTDSTITKGGFKVQYSVSSTAPECGETTFFSGITGTILSPFFEGKRQLNVSCTYIIGTNRSSTIHLEILSIHLDHYCDDNFLKVSCLKDNNTKSLQKHSRNLCSAFSVRKTTFPNCSSVLINYYSSRLSDMFIIAYTVQEIGQFCGNASFTDTTGNITFPRPSANFVEGFNCSYSILAPNLSTISLTVWSVFNKTYGSKACSGDWIQIGCTDGLTANDSKMITHDDCSNTEDSHKLLTFSDCKEVDLIFHSDSFDTGRVFRVYYTTTKTNDLANDSRVLSTTTPDVRCEKGCFMDPNKTFCVCSGAQSDGGHGSKTYNIVIPFVIIIVLAVVLALVFVWLRRRQRKQSQDQMPLQMEEEDLGNPDSTKSSRRREENELEVRYTFNPGRVDEGYVRMKSLTSEEQDSLSGTEFSNDLQPILSADSSRLRITQ